MRGDIIIPSISYHGLDLAIKTTLVTLVIYGMRSLNMLLEGTALPQLRPQMLHIAP